MSVFQSSRPKSLVCGDAQAVRYIYRADMMRMALLQKTRFDLDTGSKDSRGELLSLDFSMTGFT